MNDQVAARSTPKALLWLYAIAIPLLCLGLSWLQKPQLLDFSHIGGPPAVPSDGRQRLFSTNGATVYFTNADLLKANVGVDPPMALLIDLYPRLEGSSDPDSSPTGSLGNNGLTWTALIVKRLEVLNTDEKSRTALIGSFSAQFRGAPKLKRGEITEPIFLVAPNSQLVKDVGVRAVIGLGTRVPEPGHVPQEAINLPTRYRQAILAAFAAADKNGIRAVAIPFIPLAEKVTKDSPSTRDSWNRLLKVVLEATRTGGVDTVLIGAYGVSERNRERLHADFAEAWADFRGASLPKSPSALHESLRMGMLALIGMLLSAWRQAREVSWRSLLVVIVASTLVASSLAGVFTWLEPITNDALSAIAIVLCKFAAAFVGGFFARELLSFDAKKELTA